MSNVQKPRGKKCVQDLVAVHVLNAADSIKTVISPERGNFAQWGGAGVQWNEIHLEQVEKTVKSKEMRQWLLEEYSCEREKRNGIT